MNEAPRKSMTLGEFLAWEERQELRYEFDGRNIVDRSGGTAAHATILTNLVGALHPRLRGSRCKFVGSSLKFITGQNTVRYPDGMAICAELDLKATIVENPTVVFEVLSPSTSFTDRIVKALEYQATPSVRRYVMIEQNSHAATVSARGAGGAWTVEILVDDEMLAMPEIGVELPLVELYEGLNFDLPGGEPAPEGAEG